MAAVPGPPARPLQTTTRVLFLKLRGRCLTQVRSRVPPRSRVLIRADWSPLWRNLRTHLVWRCLPHRVSVSFSSFYFCSQVNLMQHLKVSKFDEKIQISWKKWYSGPKQPRNLSLVSRRCVSSCRGSFFCFVFLSNKTMAHQSQQRQMNFRPQPGSTQEKGSVTPLPKISRQWVMCHLVRLVVVAHCTQNAFSYFLLSFIIGVHSFLCFNEGCLNLLKRLHSSVRQCWLRQR